MRNLSLCKEKSEYIAEALKEVGYIANQKKDYTSFSNGYGDKTYIKYNLRIIRATKNTDGERIIADIFGDPNGKASDSQNDRYSTWFFNGYSGRAGSKVY